MISFKNLYGIFMYQILPYLVCQNDSFNFRRIFIFLTKRGKNRNLQSGKFLYNMFLWNALEFSITIYVYMSLIPP